jgi:hypothetical protein
MTTQDTKPRWLCEREVGEMLGVTTKKLQFDRYSRQGIAYSKVGRCVRYALSDVLAYMEACKICHG